MAEISIIVPVYNEAEFILPFYYELKKHVPKEIELIWVDDGSTDSTLAEIEQLATLDSRIRCVTLTRNFGQAAAVSAGIDFALASTIIIMSGNLKHPPSLIPHMLKKLNEGFEVVNAFPETNQNNTLFLKGIFNLFYKVIDRIASERNSNSITSFRAFNSKVSDGIRQLKERNLVLENFFTWAGYQTASIQYHCPKCSKKETLYSFAHLRNETYKAVQSLNPSVIKSFFTAGWILLGAATYSTIRTVEQLNPQQPVQPFIFIFHLLLFTVGVVLLIKSKYRLLEKRLLKSSNRLPDYIVKDVIEQDHSYSRFIYEMQK